MKTYSSMIARIEAMRVEAEALRLKERAGVVERIRHAMHVYEIKVEEVSGPYTPPPEQPVTPRVTKTSSSPKPERPTRYRNPQTGEEWSGYGGHPKWVRDVVSAGKMTFAEFAEKFAAPGFKRGEKEAKWAEQKRRQRERARAKAKAGAVRPRYVDPVSGRTWSGGGPMPGWFVELLKATGKPRDAYLNPELGTPTTNAHGAHH